MRTRRINEDRDPIILVVDDEEIVLDSIKSFFAIDTNYQLITYTSPFKALGDLDRNQRRIDLVISDYSMPEMDGIAFLSRVKDRFPMVPRILLTGHADKESAIKAINRVGLYQYIEKPWDNEGLKLVVRNGLEKNTLLNELEDRISQIEEAHRELSEVQKDILRVFA
jgi:DNA-binding NtrC family response regulator